MTVDRLTQITADIATARQQFHATRQALAGNPDYSQEFKAGAAAKNRDAFYQQIGRLTVEAKVIRAAAAIVRGLTDVQVTASDTTPSPQTV